MTSASSSLPIDAPAVKTARRGIVLGGGGVLGGTWAIGALCALEQTHGFAASSAEVIVGTSAGSVLGALIGCGVSAEELRQHNNEEVVSGGPLAGYHWDPARATGGSRPALPRLPAPGSVKLIGSSLRHLGQLPTTAVLSARGSKIPGEGWPFSGCCHPRGWLGAALRGLGGGDGLRNRQTGGVRTLGGTYLAATGRGDGILRDSRLVCPGDNRRSGLCRWRRGFCDLG